MFQFNGLLQVLPPLLREVRIDTIQPLVLPLVLQIVTKQRPQVSLVQCLERLAALTRVCACSSCGKPPHVAFPCCF